MIANNETRYVMGGAKFIRVSLLIVLISSLLSCGQTNYSIDVVNYGRNGVFISSIETEHGSYEPKLALDPALPNVADELIWLRKYFVEKHPSKPPELLTVSWQLAELFNCETVFSTDKVSGHIRKKGCTWRLIDGKTFEQSIDLTKIRESEAYKRHGDSYEEVAWSRQRLQIILVFREEELDVELYTFADNPWL